MNTEESQLGQEPIEDATNVVRVDFGKKAVNDHEYSLSSCDKAPRGDEKLFAFQKLIEMGMVMVTLDARTHGVRVPTRFKNDLQLHLNFSHRFGIDDFQYDERGVQASLSFQGQPFRCVIPWSAVYMMRSHVDQAVAIFPEDLPNEMQDVAQELERALKSAQQQQVAAETQANTKVSDEHTETKLAVTPELHEAKAPAKPAPARGGLRLVRD